MWASSEKLNQVKISNATNLETHSTPNRIVYNADETTTKIT